jgi:hypothetical protein
MQKYDSQRVCHSLG